MNTIHSDQAPFSALDDSVVADLRRAVLTRSPAPKRAVRRPAIAAAGVAAVTAVVVGFTSFGGAQAAYAVERTGGGDIRIEIHRLDDAAGLEKALASYGIDAKVDYQALKDSGGSGIHAVPGSDGPAGQPGSELQQGSDSGATVTSSSGSATSASGSSSAGTPGEKSPCGGPDDQPLSTELHPDDFVITIPKGSALTKADSSLKITTTGALADSIAGLNINFSIGGVDCGFGTMSASAR